MDVLFLLALITMLFTDQVSLSDVSCRVAVQAVCTASFSAVPCARLPASSRAFCALSLLMCHVTHALFDAAAFLPRRSGHAQGVPSSYEGPVPYSAKHISLNLIRG